MGRRRAGTLVLTAAILAAGAALFLGPVDTLPPTPSPMRLPWPVLAALFAAAVILRVQVQTDREVHSITLVELPLVLGLFLVDPLGLVVARLAGSIPALVLAARQPGRRPLFDTSLALLEASVAVVVFDAVLGGDDPRGTPGMVATFTAVLAADLLSAILVMTATRLQDGVVGWRPVIQALVTGAVAAITTTSLALTRETIPLPSWARPERRGGARWGRRTRTRGSRCTTGGRSQPTGRSRTAGSSPRYAATRS
jgi:hypothetical protein